MEFNEQRFHKINLWIGATLLALSVLFLILGVTTANGQDNATVPPQKEVTPQYKGTPPGYATGVHFRAIKVACGPQSGLSGVLKAKNMVPIFRGQAIQNYMFNGGETTVTTIIFFNQKGEFVVTSWLGGGFACLELLGHGGEMIPPSFSQI
jgi:Mn2+/Fe2+ NRAMP family transporter